jgi:hypothetical protein
MHHQQHNHWALTTTPVATVSSHRDLVKDPEDISNPWLISADEWDGQGKKKIQVKVLLLTVSIMVEHL